MKSLKYGIAASILLSITFSVTYSLEWYKSFRHTALSIIELVLYVVAIYLYLREIIKSKYANEIKFSHAVLEGLKVVLIVGFLHSVFTYTYFSVNEKAYTNYKEYTFEAQIAAAKNANFSEQQLKDYVQLMQKESNPFNFAKINFILVTLLGLIFVLVFAAILRKKDSYPTFNDSELKKE